MGIFLSIFFAVLSCSEKVLESQTADGTQTKNPSLKSASHNYYVATTGSDSNTGTLASPFKTIQKAADVVNPGDTVIVRDGTYTSASNEWVHISRSGTTGNVITFKAEHKGGAILDGQGLRGYCFIFDSGVSYVNISGFEIKNFMWFAIDINQTTNPVNHVTISDNNIHHIGRYDDTSSLGHCGVFLHKATDIIFERNVFHDIGRLDPSEGGTSTTYKNHDHGLYIAGCNHLTIRYNIFYNCNRGWGIQVYNSNSLLVSNLVIVNNTFAYNGEYRNGSHITLCYTITDATIKNNIFYGTSDWALSLYSANITATNVSITNNISSSIMSPEVPSGVTFANNQLNTDPLIVSPGTYNFHLQATSPAIAKGVNVGLTTDYLKNVITGVPDIGSIEYQGTSAVYYNTQASAKATKSDCGTGSTGSAVTYTVPASKYSSTVSQADAESKALADLTANKQTYANSNGTCTVVSATTYYSIQQSGTATKNDCTTGSTLTYTVAAKQYSSTISQADADNKAIADVTNNKQAYANANGTCAAVTVYYNVQESGTATKNTCGTGYTGSTVTYTVAANKYSSSVSQADANNQAIADVNNNKQLYANANGSCTANTTVSTTSTTKRKKWWQR